MVEMNNNTVDKTKLLSSLP